MRFARRFVGVLLIASLFYQAQAQSAEVLQAELIQQLQREYSWGSCLYGRRTGMSCVG
jgi:hypothetical protein